MFARQGSLDCSRHLPRSADLHRSRTSNTAVLGGADTETGKIRRKDLKELEQKRYADRQFQADHAGKESL
jgi:hypothetical protein